MFQEFSDASWDLTSPVYDVDVQSFLVSVDLSGFVDEIAPPETAETAADLPATDPAPMVIADVLPVAADPVVPPVDPAAVDPLTPDPGTATPVTVADLSTADTTGSDTPVDLMLALSPTPSPALWPLWTDRSSISPASTSATSASARSADPITQHFDGAEV